MADWDRSLDWVLRRTHHERYRLQVNFSQDRPNKKDLIALRRCFPQFKDMPPAKLVELCGESGSLDLGLHSPFDARTFAAIGEAAGLQIVIQNASFISYLPVDRTFGSALLIEDEAESDRIVGEMISAGVPVEIVYAN